MSFWWCRLCEVSYSSPWTLVEHVLTGQRHKDMVSYHAPEQLESLSRLQPFLDFYMKEAALLGLEHIVEEKQEDSTYSYYCNLCHMQEVNLLETFHHIIDMPHMMRCIYRDHTDASIKGKSVRGKKVYMKRLQMKFFKILRNNRYEGMQVKKTVICYLAPHEVAIPPRPKKVVSRKDGPLLCDTQGTAVKHYCDLCDVLSNSAAAFYGHIIGRKHRQKLKNVDPEQLKYLDRLQYFLDAYMPEDPILGLEYILEQRVNSKWWYKYTCQLCHVEGRLMKMVAHITDVSHMGRYINKHFPAWSVKEQTFSTRDDYVKAVTEVAFAVCEEHGRRSIQYELTAISHTAPAEGHDANGGTLPPPSMDLQTAPAKDHNKNGSILPPPSMDLQTAPVEDHNKNGSTLPPPLMDLQTAPAEGHNENGGTLPHPSMDLQTAPAKDHNKNGDTLPPPWTDLQKQCICSLCDQVCKTMLELCIHIKKDEHRKKLDRVAPKEVKALGRLQYFLDTHAKEYPLLGLEYIVEEQLDDTKYSYTCQMCHVKGVLQVIVNHMANAPHMSAYIDKHHPTSLSAYTHTCRDEYLRALAAVAVEIHAKYGHSKYQLKRAASNGPSPAEEVRLTISDNNEEDDSLPSGSQVETEQQSQYSQRHEAEVGAMTAVEELEFTSSVDFLEYLQHFEIIDNEDASFIQQINQNCMKALLGFWTEETSKLEAIE